MTESRRPSPELLNRGNPRPDGMAAGSARRWTSLEYLKGGTLTRTTSAFQQEGAAGLSSSPRHAESSSIHILLLSVSVADSEVLIPRKHDRLKGQRTETLKVHFI